MVRGDYLVVLTKTPTLEVYNSHLGRRLHSWRVARGAALLDVSNGLASYVSPRVVHVVRLVTGRSTFSARTRSRITAAQLEPAGLVYALATPRDAGTLVYVPLRRVD